MSDKYQGLGLSEEELLALEGEEDETVGAIDGLDDDDSDSDADDNDDDEQADGDDQPTEPNSEDGSTDEPADETGDETDPEFTPKVEPVADYDTKIAELVSKEDELAEQFDMGEITQREYRQQIREIDSQRRALEDQQRDFQKSQEIAEQKWNWEVDNFMETMKEQGVDYRANKLLNAALDTAVKELANDPKNNDKSGKWFLNEAHKQVAELMGKSMGDQKPKDPLKKSLNERKPNLDRVPQTLGQVPQAQNDVAGQDEFSKLDQLSGMDLERALAALPESKARAYLER